MKNFLKEYWLWILIPFVIVIGILVAAYVLGGGDGTSPFQYNVLLGDGHGLPSSHHLTL